MDTQLCPFGVHVKEVYNKSTQCLYYQGVLKYYRGIIFVSIGLSGVKKAVLIIKVSLCVLVSGAK